MNDIFILTEINAIIFVIILLILFVLRCAGYIIAFFGTQAENGNMVILGLFLYIFSFVFALLLMGSIIKANQVEIVKVINDNSIIKEVLYKGGK